LRQIQRSILCVAVKGLFASHPFIAPSECYFHSVPYRSVSQSLLFLLLELVIFTAKSLAPNRPPKRHGYSHLKSCRFCVSSPTRKTCFYLEIQEYQAKWDYAPLVFVHSVPCKTKYCWPTVRTKVFYFLVLCYWVIFETSY